VRRFILPKQCAEFKKAPLPIPDLARRGELHKYGANYAPKLKRKKIYQRGDEFYDWDGHAFHFFGGIPKNADGSLALYTPKEQDEYLRQLTESLKKGVQP